MFGQHLDYIFLRLFVHNKNIATEAQLNETAVKESAVDISYALSRFQKIADRFNGHFPISSSLKYLDIGCGNGDLAIAMAKSGCQHVAGVDIIPRRIHQAKHNAEFHEENRNVVFYCENIYHWNPPHLYDVIFSYEALEHIDKPDEFLRLCSKLLAPNGILVLGFGPLFHSPFGDHNFGFFRLQVPWRGALFSEQAILRLRREYFRPTDDAERYQEMVGGLNLMRYSDFLRYVKESGWEFEYLCINPQLKRVPFLYHFIYLLIKIPYVRDYFASSVYAILRRHEPEPSH
jgi:SAM-dependent methyltransferase